MATERVETRLVTLRDTRGAKVVGEILAGGWELGEQKPLLEPLQAMADDIVQWFNPEQRWKFAGVRIGLINFGRIAEASVDPDRPEKESLMIKARREEPYKLTPVFHFVAERPPLRTKDLVGRQKVLNLPAVFAPNFRDRVEIWSEGSADILIDHIGPVHRLEQALRELSSPYYLVRVTVVAKSRQHVSTTAFELVQQIETGIKPEPSKELEVIVYMRDLMDQIRLDANQLRRMQRQLGKKFPPFQPTQEGAPQS